MKEINRRGFLRAAGLFVGGTALSGCASDLAATLASTNEALKVQNQVLNTEKNELETQVVFLQGQVTDLYTTNNKLEGTINFQATAVASQPETIVIEDLLTEGQKGWLRLEEKVSEYGLIYTSDGHFVLNGEYTDDVRQTNVECQDILSFVVNKSCTPTTTPQPPEKTKQPPETPETPEYPPEQ